MVGLWLSGVTVIDGGIDGCPVALWITRAHSRVAGGCAVVQQSGSNQLVHYERLTTNSREDSSSYLAISPLGWGERFREKRRSLSSYRYGWERPRFDGLFPDPEDHLELHLADIRRFVLVSMEIRIVACGLSGGLTKDDDWEGN